MQKHLLFDSLVNFATIHTREAKISGPCDCALILDYDKGDETKITIHQKIVVDSNQKPYSVHNDNGFFSFNESYS